MTRKDFELIAHDIRVALEGIRPETDKPGDGLRWLAVELSRDLQQTNPQFDRNRFLEACGVPLV